MRYDPDLYGPPEEGNEDPTMDDEWEALMELARERPGVDYPWHDEDWVIAQNRSLDRGGDDG